MCVELLNTKPKWNEKVPVKCPICKQVKFVNLNNHLQKIKLYPNYRCVNCARQHEQSQEFRQKVGKSIRNCWADKKYRNKKIKNAIVQWQDPIKREALLKALRSDDFKAKIAKLNNLMPKISSQQEIVYSILEDFNIKFDKEYKIGYYAFDCHVAPQLGIKLKEPLLIEIQGDYWHSLPKSEQRDKSKSTYLKTYFPNYNLKYLWEHEFDNKDRITDLLKYWLGISQSKLKAFDFKCIEERIVDYKEAELFISKYHYAGRIGRSGINLGYYVNNILIAVIIYISPTRQETATKQGLAYKEMLELSRLAIHPQYQMNNLASHLISRSINYIKINNQHIKSLVSFADLTHNHSGVIYKASNWVLDGEVQPDYWYKDESGYVCHKKTLWNKANKFGLTEGEYCAKHNYVKIWGEKKLRYIYNFRRN